MNYLSSVACCFGGWRSPGQNMARVGNHKQVIALLSSLLLTMACETQSVSTPPTKAIASPGSKSVTWQEAVSFFEICEDSAPSFANAASMLRDRSFAQNPKTGTWYHPTLDLSVKVSPGATCSMVFSSRSNPVELSLAMALGSTHSGTIGVDPSSTTTRTKGVKGTIFTFAPAGNPQGAPYFRAALTNS